MCRRRARAGRFAGPVTRFSPRRARLAPRPADLGASAREWQAGPKKARGPGPGGASRARQGARAGPGTGPSRARRPTLQIDPFPIHPISPTRPRRPQLRAGPGGGGPYWSCPPLARPRATAGDPAAANPPHLHPAASYHTTNKVLVYPSMEASSEIAARPHRVLPAASTAPAASAPGAREAAARAPGASLTAEPTRPSLPMPASPRPAASRRSAVPTRSCTT